MARGQASATPPVGSATNKSLSGTGVTMFALTGSSVYDINKFYTNGTDSKGHYERVRAKMTPSLQALCEQVVAEVADYNSVEDMIRDALLHRVMHFKVNGVPIDEQAIKREAATAEMNRLRAIVAAQSQYVDDCMTTIDTFTEVHDWARLEDVLNDMEGRLVEGQLPPKIADKLEEAIDYGWNTMRTEVTRKQLRRKASEG